MVKPHERTSPESPSSPTQYCRLRQGKAAKLSPHAKGEVSFDVLTNADRSDVFISIIGSASSAYFSRQPVSISQVESIVNSMSTGKPLSARAFRDLYVNKSVNNVGFLACALVGEDLLGRVPDKAHGLVNRENWESWKASCLAAASGELEVVSFGPKPSSEVELTGDVGPEAAEADATSAQPGEVGETGAAGEPLTGKARRRGKVKE